MRLHFSLRFCGIIQSCRRFYMFWVSQYIYNTQKCAKKTQQRVLRYHCCIFFAHLCVWHKRSSFRTQLLQTYGSYVLFVIPTKTVSFNFDVPLFHGPGLLTFSSKYYDFVNVLLSCSIALCPLGFGELVPRVSWPTIFRRYSCYRG